MRQIKQITKQAGNNIIMVYTIWMCNYEIPLRKVFLYTFAEVFGKVF